MVDELIAVCVELHTLRKLACAAADAWAHERAGAGRDFSDPHKKTMNALETATRSLPLRKVKP